MVAGSSTGRTQSPCCRSQMKPNQGIAPRTCGCVLYDICIGQYRDGDIFRDQSSNHFLLFRGLSDTLCWLKSVWLLDPPIKQEAAFFGRD